MTSPGNRALHGSGKLAFAGAVFFGGQPDAQRRPRGLLSNRPAAVVTMGSILGEPLDSPRMMDGLILILWFVAFDAEQEGGLGRRAGRYRD